ncbi:MAG: site-specific integrase [Clostridia bacterium]|nr:site-specific integrase [Clostridia bacterium]
MNKKGTRNTNGEGCIYNTIAKQKRKKFLPEECSICKNCKDRTACNNRTGYDKCKKCEECKTECLNYCDRFYCYDRNQAQITINGKQTTVANEKKRKDAVQKKKETEAKVQTKAYVKKYGITLSQKILKILDSKLSSKIIGENTYQRDLDNLVHIENSDIGDIPMQKLTKDDIQDFIDSKVYLSQSCIKQILALIKIAYETAEIDKEIIHADNPMLKVRMPISDLDVQEVIPFEVHEQITLMKYITSNNLIRSNKNSYDSKTIKNIIIIGLLTGMRIGEMGALNIDDHINLELKQIKIERTLTKNKERKIIIGTATKTGKKKRKQNKPDFRLIPFGVFEEKIVESIIKEQIEIAKNNPYNKEQLLFCKKDGSYINHSQITDIFKRICREAGVKLELPKGCHIHMTRHTFTTRCIESGMDLMTIANLLGHTTTLQIEQTYGHILDKYKRQKLDGLRDYYKENKLLSSSMKKLLLVA